eukprot:IDg18270t1
MTARLDALQRAAQLFKQASTPRLVAPISDPASSSDASPSSYRAVENTLSDSQVPSTKTVSFSHDIRYADEITPVVSQSDVQHEHQIQPASSADVLEEIQPIFTVRDYYELRRAQSRFAPVLRLFGSVKSQEYVQSHMQVEGAQSCTDDDEPLIGTDYYEHKRQSRRHRRRLNLSRVRRLITCGASESGARSSAACSEEGLLQESSNDAN